MSPELITVLSSLPLHVVLMLGIAVLWLENRRLSQKIEGIADSQVKHTDMLKKQNVEIADIKAQTNGK